MSIPGSLALIKPEEGVRKPEMVDDSVLIGLTSVIDRLQVGELDAVTLADILDTFSSVLRQILSGDDLAGSYLRYPAKSIQEIANDITSINGNISKLHTLQLTATEAISTFKMIRLSANDSMGLAKADISANADAIGCMIDTNKAVGETGTVAVSGKRINGILSGASFGKRYFLSTSVAGGITDVVPGPGVQLEIGRAINATDLLLDIKLPLIKVAQP